MSSIENYAIIDNGNYSVKFGLNTEKTPKILETVIAFERGQGAKTGYYIGKENIKAAYKTNMVLSTRYPLQRGFAMDWNQMEALWRNCFDIMNFHNDVLLTHCAIIPKEQRDTMIEIMFEQFDVQNLALEISGVLSYLSQTRDSESIVVDSGGGLTTFIPIVDSIPMKKSIVQIPLAGQDINDYLNRLLIEKGYVMDKKEEWRILQHIKHNMTYVAYDFDDELKGVKEDIEQFRQELELQTGEKIVLDSESFRCTELLFDPSLQNIRAKGIHEIVWGMIQKFDEPKSLVLAGGTMKIPGLAERLDKELKEMGKLTGKKMKLSPKVAQENASWVGGTKVAPNWISRKDYEDIGSR